MSEQVTSRLSSKPAHPGLHENPEQGSAILFGLMLSAFVGFIIYTNMQKVEDYWQDVQLVNENAIYRELVDESGRIISCQGPIEVKKGSCSGGQMEPSKDQVREQLKRAITLNDRAGEGKSEKAGSYFYNKLAVQRIECYRAESTKNAKGEEMSVQKGSRSCENLAAVLPTVRPLPLKNALKAPKDNLNQNMRVVESLILPEVIKRFQEKERDHDKHVKNVYEPAEKTLAAEQAAYAQCESARQAAVAACAAVQVSPGEAPPPCPAAMFSCPTAALENARTRFEQARVEREKLFKIKEDHKKLQEFVQNDIVRLKKTHNVKVVTNPELDALARGPHLIAAFLASKSIKGSAKLLDTIGDASIMKDEGMATIKLRYLELQPYCTHAKNDKGAMVAKLKFRGRIDYDSDIGIKSLSVNARKLAEQSLRRYLYDGSLERKKGRVTDWAELPDNLVPRCRIIEVEDASTDKGDPEDA
jgi:hypothetical protein